MSTKQPAVAVVSRLNQQSPLSLLDPPFVKCGPLGVSCSKSFEPEAFHFRRIFRMCVSLYTLKSVRM